MFKCNPFMGSSVWRSWTVKQSPWALRQASNWCTSRWILSTRNSMGCCWNCCTIFALTSSSSPNLHSFNTFMSNRAHGSLVVGTLGCMGHGPTLSNTWHTMHHGQCESHGDGTVFQNGDIFHEHIETLSPDPVRKSWRVPQQYFVNGSFQGSWMPYHRFTLTWLLQCLSRLYLTASTHLPRTIPEQVSCEALHHFHLRCNKF